jgi:hydrogenase expression/formation protein HypD
MDSSAFRDPEIARGFLDRIESLSAGVEQPLTLMEVCGTHTMAIHQHGLRALLPKKIRLVSGPGCPVCVTPVDYLDHAVALCREPNITIATFGDMVRVPGSSSSLLNEKARGADVQILYSPLDALKLATENPERQIVFLGVGFETTTPTIAGTISEAARLQLKNFSVLCAHKTMPAPMAALTADEDLQIDGYICPAHVSAIIGVEAYRPLAEDYATPCVVTGFEPLDIVQGIEMLIAQISTGESRVENQYRRFVKTTGNLKAQALSAEVFEPCTANWRGIGPIPDSGLKIRAKYAAFDAALKFSVEVEEPQEPKGCCCGEILKGKLTPQQCPLFGGRCTPENPVGACMVSSEGTCAAAYKYDF